METQRRGRGSARIKRRTFRKGYRRLRLCERTDFIHMLMAAMDMDWNNAVRVCRIGLAATHQRRGDEKRLERIFETFKIYDIWDD